MIKIKSIIFDCDGVLVDSEKISNDVLVSYSNELGAHLDYEDSLQFFKGKSMNLCMESISKIIGKPLPDNFEQEFRRRTKIAFEKDIQPIDGVIDLVSSLKLPFCVASSGPKPKIQSNLTHTGLIQYFKNNMFSCYDIQKWKPEPDIFIHAAKEMGFNKENTVIVEDTLPGATAAKNAGFFTIGYAGHDYNNDLPSVADITFKTMKELKDFIFQNS